MFPNADGEDQVCPDRQVGGGRILSNVDPPPFRFLGPSDSRCIGDVDRQTLYAGKCSANFCASPAFGTAQ